MKKMELPDKNKDVIEEAFRLGWESAIALKDMIDAQSEDIAIDNLRGIAYALYFEALHEKCVKEAPHDKDEAVLDVLLFKDDNTQIKGTVTVVDRYPCHDCGQDPTWCCGCEEERMWKEKHKK